MNILVVDDSIVFRTQISASLSEVDGIKVVGTAPNGKIAIQKLQNLSVDLITLDMEMPELNGIDTIKELKRKGISCKIIVFSSQTIRGAEKAMEALEVGADDVVAKPTGDSMDFSQAQKMIEEALIPRIFQFINKKQVTPAVSSAKVIVDRPAQKVIEKKNLKRFKSKAIVIASSTGGPTALENIFSNLKCTPSVPVLIVQHMPPVFTQILAKRLGEISGIQVHEAVHNQRALPGNVYVAPGGFHMTVSKDDKGLVIKLNEDPYRNSVRPAADFLFESMNEIFPGELLGIVLTGMGEDGAAGAKAIHQKGGGIIIQEKESCVVFGMPGAVFLNDDYDDIMTLEQIAEYIRTVVL